jgi:phosphotransferase system HPr-like phosphotransfer protein
MSRNIHLGTLDELRILKDAGAITASAAGTVASAAKVINLGKARTDAKAIINVSAAGVGTGEKQTITIQVADAAAFNAKIHNVAILELGDAAQLPGNVDVGVGSYELPFNTVVNGVNYPFVRVYATIAVVSPVTSLNYTCHLVTQ